MLVYSHWAFKFLVLQWDVSSVVKMVLSQSHLFHCPNVYFTIMVALSVFFCYCFIKAICWFSPEPLVWCHMLSPKLETWLLTHLSLWVAALCCSSFISLSQLPFMLERWGLFLQLTSSCMDHKSCVISVTVYYNGLTCQVRMSSRLSCLHGWFLYCFF